MGLNVQWRWGMPQVANPDQVAAGNRQEFSSGLDALVSGLFRRDDKARQDAEIARQQANLDRQFAEQQEQRKIQNAMQERQFAEQKRMNDQSLANQQWQLQKDQEQRQWMQKFYDQFFGDDPEYQELKQLRAKFANAGGVPDSALIMMGLNPRLR